MPTLRVRAGLLATATLAAALIVAPSAPALAAGSGGWLRVAHLSPDTASVDIRLVPLSGGSTVRKVDDVAYGEVSKYWSLPPGRYAVAMRPAGAPADSTPVVQTSVAVQQGGASTFAVFGRNAALKTRLIEDSLTLPRSGDARVRVIQASTTSQPVTVTAAPDTTIVSDAASTTVSPYADVRAGTWRLTATRGTDRATSTIDLRAGQIASVFVLDDAGQGIAIRRVLDSASVGGVPKGYLATGGGFLAHESDTRSSDLLMLGGVSAAALAAASAVALGRRRRARG